MLLLFLSILFFQHDLLHCGQKASGKDVFMDYSITEFWWNGTPGIDQTDRITPQYSFLPTPIGWIMNADFTPYSPAEPSIPSEALATFFPFPNTTRPSYPFDIVNYTIVTPSRPGPPPSPEPWHIQYPGLTPPPNFPSDYRYPTIYPYYTDEAYIPSPTGPTPKGPSFTLPEVDRPAFTFPTVPTPSKNPPGYVPDWVSSSTTPKPEYMRPFTLEPLAPYVKKWNQEIVSYAAAHSWTPTNVVPKLSQVFNYDYKTEGALEAIRRIPKIAQDAGSNLKSSVFEDQPRSILREEITVIERKEANSVFGDEASKYDPPEEVKKETLTTSTMQSQNTDDSNDVKKTTSRKSESRFLRVVKKREEWWQSDQTVTTTPTTIKEFFRPTTKPNHSRERQRIRNSLKRRISIKRHLINRTKHQDSNEDTYRRQIIQAAEKPMLRNMLPITRHQKRFRVITPRQLRSNAYLDSERPTKDFFYRRLVRPLHPPNGMLQFFPQVTKESEKD